jgi:serine/alanine adding enzyme
MAFHVTSTPEIDAWRRFIKKHPDGNIFHTPEMAAVFNHAKHLNSMVLACINHNKEIISLILVVYVKTNGGISLRLSSRCISYGGILYRTDSGRESLAHILDALDMTARPVSLLTEIRNISDTSSFKDNVICNGYKYLDYINYLVPLDMEPEDIFRGFSRTRRQNIKNLEKDGLCVQEIQERKGITAVYNILRSTYHRVKVPLADISLFQAAFDILYSRGMARFYLAKSREEEIAAAVALFYKKTIYLWYLGTKKEFMKMSPASLLVWHLVKWGSQNDYKILDFLGAGRPNENYGVCEFKKRFGGIKVNYGRYQKVHSSQLLKLSEKAYKLYRIFL